MFLPEQRYTGPFNDDEWIKEQLDKLPAAWRPGTIKKYSIVFEEKGRAAANTWIREGVRDFGIK